MDTLKKLIIFALIAISSLTASTVPDDGTNDDTKRSVGNKRKLDEMSSPLASSFSTNELKTKKRVSFAPVVAETRYYSDEGSDLECEKDTSISSSSSSSHDTCALRRMETLDFGLPETENSDTALIRLETLDFGLLETENDSDPETALIRLDTIWE